MNDGRASRIDTIVCGELGTAAQDRWSRPVRFALDDLDFLKTRVLLCQIDLREVDSGAIQVSGRDYCGRIRLPSGRHLSIRSKVNSTVILGWLAYVSDIPHLTHWESGPTVESGDDVAHVLVEAYLDVLVTVTKFHLRPGYESTRLVSDRFRGSLDERALARHVTVLPRLPIVVRDRTLHTTANRLLATALDACPRLVSNRELSERSRRSLSWLMTQWADIKRGLADIEASFAMVRSRSPIGCSAALDIARLLLVGVSFDLSNGDGGESFLVRMSTVWERAVRRMARAWAKAHGWRVEGYAAGTRPWEDHLRLDERQRWLTPDVVLRCRTTQRTVALDAKYKLAFGDESRVDRFQASTYALAFGAWRSALVYPTAESNAPLVERLLRAGAHGVDCEVLSMNLPMAAGSEVCRASLSRALSGLGF